MSCKELINMEDGEEQLLQFLSKSHHEPSAGGMNNSQLIHSSLFSCSSDGVS